MEASQAAYILGGFVVTLRIRRDRLGAWSPEDGAYALLDADHITQVAERWVRRVSGEQTVIAGPVTVEVIEWWKTRPHLLVRARAYRDVLPEHRANVVSLVEGGWTRPVITVPF